MKPTSYVCFYHFSYMNALLDPLQRYSGHSLYGDASLTCVGFGMSYPIPHCALVLTLIWQLSSPSYHHPSWPGIPSLLGLRPLAEGHLSYPFTPWPSVYQNRHLLALPNWTLSAWVVQEGMGREEKGSEENGKKEWKTRKRLSFAF